MDDRSQISGRQIAAGRALAGLSREELSRASHVSLETLDEMEANAPPLGVGFTAVRAALDAVGVEFIGEDGGGPGVRLKKCWRGPASIPLEELSAENDE
jgi:hypothetical protein